MSITYFYHAEMFLPKNAFGWCQPYTGSIKITTKHDELVMICIANSNSFLGSNNSNLEEQYISETQFMAIQIDKQFKVTKQVVYDLSEKIQGFDTFGGIILRKINNGQFFGYHETEFDMTTKAKLS